MKKMTISKLKKILCSLGVEIKNKAVSFVAFKNQEDGEDYAVWRVNIESVSYVLKEAKPKEVETYLTFFRESIAAVPTLYRWGEVEGVWYILMEYIAGETVLGLNRHTLTLALDALIDLQKRFWGKEEPEGCPLPFQATWESRVKRGEYLGDAIPKEAYSVFLKAYGTLQRTLCHDDLLPFNVMVTAERAVLVDWEFGGILPYLTSIARLLAHGEDSENAFFFLKNEDKDFAIEYYYDHLVKDMGIAYNTYRKDLDCFFFYELCEWVMLGQKYGNTESERYKRYLALAKEMAKNILLH